MSGNYAAKAVANAFIKKALENPPHDVSPMKLQKLIYFAHGWHLANFGEPLIQDVIQAWQYGPVIRAIYHEFKDCGTEPIDRLAETVLFEENRIKVIQPDIEPDDEKAKAIVDGVWQNYGKFTAVQLSNLTHKPGSPWEQVTQAYGRVPHDLNIPNPLIEQCFRNELEASRNG